MTVIKICGLQEPDDAAVAIDSGADLLGAIMVPGRKRTADHAKVAQIAQLCKQRRSELKREYIESSGLLKVAMTSPKRAAEWFEENAERIRENGPYLAGVFRNQPLEDVQKAVEELGLDLVQLHGSEDAAAYAAALPVPVIARFVLNKPTISHATEDHEHYLTLLDSEAGGEGKLISWADASEFYTAMGGRFLLAGGLTPENVAQAVKVDGCLGVDVSGGTETDGVKDQEKIKAFVTNGRS